MLHKEITEEEWELIEAIRNYKKSYPNGARNLLKYAKELFDSLTSIF